MPIVTPNRHGVYEHRERIEFRSPPMTRAGITIAETEQGWRSAIGFQLGAGNLWGKAEPIIEQDEAFETREQAIKNAVWRLGCYLKQCQPQQQAEAREIMDWANGWMVRQMDLFA